MSRSNDFLWSGTAWAILSASSLTVMANSTVSPALPGIAKTFQDVDRIDQIAGLVVSLPALSVLITAGLVGWLADRFNRKHFLICAMFFFGLSGSLGGLSSSIEMLLASRLALGLGVAAILTLSVSIAGSIFDGSERQRFMGLQSAAVSVGGVVFMSLGGVLSDQNWRLAFLVYALAFPLAIFVACTLPPLKETVKIEKRSTAIPWNALTPILAFGFFTMLGFYLIPTRLPFVLAEIADYPPSVAGFTISGVTIGSFVSSFFFGRVRNFLQPSMIALVSLLLLSIGLVLIGLATSLALVALGVLCVGLALGQAMPNLNAWAMEVASPDMRGRVAGLLTCAIFSGQLAAPITAGIIEIQIPVALGVALHGFFLTGACLFLCAYALLRRKT